MKIAFDYDGTISEDLKGWLQVMNMMSGRGHDVFVVTFRDERFDINEDLKNINRFFEVYYTRGVAKRWWCQQFGPGEVDVWIDDKPEAILNNSNLTVDGLAQWREECKLAKSA